MSTPSARTNVLKPSLWRTHSWCTKRTNHHGHHVVCWPPSMGYPPSSGLWSWFNGAMKPTSNNFSHGWLNELGPDRRRWNNSTSTSRLSVGSCAWTYVEAPALLNPVRASWRTWTSSRSTCPVSLRWRSPRRRHLHPPTRAKEPKGWERRANLLTVIDLSHTAKPTSTSTATMTRGHLVLSLGNTRRTDRSPIRMNGSPVPTNRDSTGSLTCQRYPTSQSHQMALSFHPSYRAKENTLSSSVSLMASGLLPLLWHSSWGLLVYIWVGRLTHHAMQSYASTSPTWSREGTSCKKTPNLLPTRSSRSTPTMNAWYWQLRALRAQISRLWMPVHKVCKVPRAASLWHTASSWTRSWHFFPTIGWKLLRRTWSWRRIRRLPTFPVPWTRHRCYLIPLTLALSTGPDFGGPKLIGIKLGTTRFLVDLSTGARATRYTSWHWTCLGMTLPPSTWTATPSILTWHHTRCVFLA